MGKGGGNEERDTILTDSSVMFLDALGEGKIKGLVKGAESIYLGGVPLKNADGTFNFTVTGTNAYNPIAGGESLPGLFSYGIVPGSISQNYIPGFDAVQSEESVNQQVRQPLPVTVGITTANLNAIGVIVQIPRLVFTDEEGNTKRTELSYTISLKVDSGIFVVAHQVDLFEKSSGGFEVQRIVLLPTNYTSIQIKVTRLTADSTSDRKDNTMSFKSYTKIQYAKYSYPMLAIVAMEINSKILSGGVKERKYDIYAREISIPSNATVNPDNGSLTYSGTWDGIFQAPIWCADPAWCLYDLITNNRYGANVSPVIMNRTKWDYYTASVWCNELVSNGKGGSEPRYLLNVLIETQQQAQNLVAQLASVFGGIFFLSGGSIALAVDSPRSPVTMFSNDSATFNYQGSALRQRYTIAKVSWRNPDLLGEFDRTVVEDDVGLEKYGRRETTIEAVGCTSLSQARRWGYWYLLTGRLQASTLLITTNIRAARLRPTEVVEIADKNKSAFMMGRLVGSVSNQFILDQAVSLDPAFSWRIRYLRPNGTSETRQIATTSATPVTTISLANPPSIMPIDDSIWVIQTSTAKAPPQYQVLSALPSQDDPDKWEVTAVQHAPNKWDMVNAGLTVIDGEKPKLPTTPNKPRNLSAYTISAPSIQTVTGTIDKLEAMWDYPLLTSGEIDNYTRSYVFGYRLEEDPTFTTISTTSRSVEIAGLTPGSYWLYVLAVDVTGRRSLDISLPNTIPIGLAINASSQWSNVSSVYLLSAGFS
jgi:predicted phage tail protein